MSALSTPRPKLHIVSNADANFLPGLAVALASAVAVSSGESDYHALILDGGLPAGAIESLEKTIAGIGARKGIRATLELLAVDQNRLLALPPRRDSRMTYAKLVLPEILSHLDSIIYLDADVVCFKGVEEVHPPAGESEYLLAGARDFFGVIEKDCPWIDQVPARERRLPYINCGVMWMNLKGLREMDFTERSIAHRAAAGEARQGDQAVFNFLCRGKSFILPDSVNHRTGLGSNQPLCEGNLDLNIHYIGSPKPWLGAPKTSNWLAHQLWHQANAVMFPGMGEAQMDVPPFDQSSFRRKALLYALINPPRAAQYRNDLRSLQDPGSVREKAKLRLDETLGAGAR